MPLLGGRKLRPRETECSSPCHTATESVGKRDIARAGSPDLLALLALRGGDDREQGREMEMGVE